MKRRFHIDQNTGLIIESAVDADGNEKAVKAHEPDRAQKAFTGRNPSTSPSTAQRRVTPWHFWPAVPALGAFGVALFDLLR